ncbi:hypothetical protein [Palleronia abyssalis]|uniref:Uncharacterized protein n=1 Tax=Palleronia abyssalis TaxID=1501240 RepID=A0A2R8BVH7_9RHOB|nr:hypothetical protein [Palleronia abyssalis]SPJ24130.1 hypothetical protein PAA8504_01957 [Palleronia abyssalis]
MLGDFGRIRRFNTRIALRSRVSEVSWRATWVAPFPSTEMHKLV